MDTRTGMIFNIQRYSVHDGGGIRTNVFFKGCPLRCLWCANPESQRFEHEMSVNAERCIGCMECVSRCEHQAITATTWNAEKCVGCLRCEEICPSGARTFWGHEMTVEQVAEEVMKDWPFYQNSGGGVTFTGGEPLAQPAFARELAKRLKANLLHLAVETSGFGVWDRVRPVLEQMDEILFDIKHMDDEVHKRLTGVSNRSILTNAAGAAALGKRMVVRVPVIGGYNSDEENIKKTAAFAREIGVAELHLLPYHRFGENKYAKLGKAYECSAAYTPDDGEMERLRTLAASYGLKVQIGG